MERTFLYHALASGVSGRITEPFQDLVEVQAASAIPPTGGYSSSRVENFRYKDIFSFRSSAAATTGNFSDAKQRYTTSATVTVEGVNILGVITADRVVARLVSEQSKDPKEKPVFTIAGSHFEDLRVAGCPLHVRPDFGRLVDCRRSERVDLRTVMIPLELDPSYGLKMHLDGAIEVPEFGKVYLLELLTTPCYQSLTMLRLELGCPVTGKASVAHGSTNGEFFP
jgi:hypothetical protein